MVQVGGVGDRTNNLWNDSIVTFPVSKVTRTNNLYVIDKIGESANEIISLPFDLSENKTCNLSFDAYADEGNTKIIIDGFPDSIYTGIPDKIVILSTTNTRYNIPLQLLKGNIRVRFYRTSSTTNANTSKIYLSNIQLEEGSTATDYEPYGYKVPVVVSGKNLLKPDGTPTTIRGVSWSYREDGAVVGERVSSNENVSDFTLTNSSTFKPGSYIFSRFDTESTPGSSTYQSNISINGVSHWGTGNYLFVLNEASTIRVVLRVYPNFTGTAIFKPMIRLSSIQESNYEAYIEPTTTNIYLDKPIEAKANIPSEYTEVEYLESTGTQYIDTGIVPNSDSGFKTKIVFTGHTNGIDDFVIGLRSNNTYGRFAYTCTSNTFYCSLGSTTSSLYRYNANMPSTEIIECELNYKNSNTTITQGVEGLLSGKNNFNGEGLTFYLAGAYNARGIPKYRAMRQYECELTQGTEVVRDLVPCYRKSDNVAGLYDLVNNTFYTNQGTGNFIVGPVKENESISLSDTNTNISTIEGTNTLSIDATIQPSKVYVKARKESSYEIAMRERYEGIIADYEQQLSNIESSLQEV